MWITSICQKGAEVKECQICQITTEKNWRSQKFDFLSLEKLSPGQFLGSSNSRRYHWISANISIRRKKEIQKSRTVKGDSQGYEQEN